LRVKEEQSADEWGGITRRKPWGQQEGRLANVGVEKIPRPGLQAGTTVKCPPGIWLILDRNLILDRKF
jgi:hypothetical protein